MKRWLIAICILIVFNNCKQVDDIQKLPPYSVYCVLNPSDEIISLFLGNTYSLNQEFPIDSGKYVDGASVRISTNNKSIELSLNAKNKRYEAQNLGFVNPNNSYFLEIVIGDDTLRAETKIPESKELEITKSYSSENTGFVELKWKKELAGDGRYRLSGEVQTEDLRTPYFYWDNTLFLWKTSDTYFASDEIVSPTGTFTFPSNSKKATIKLTLESMDKYWYNFANKLDAVQSRTEFSKRFEAPIYFESNITNAVGVFGSFSKDELQINLNKL